MEQSLLAGFFYAYPISMLISLSTAHIYLYRRRFLSNAPIERSKRANHISTLWYIQLCVSISLLSSSICCAFETAWSDDTDHYTLNQAQLSTYIAVFLYFGASLLPDPDRPWRTDDANLYTWLIAVAFEVGLGFGLLHVHINSDIDAQLQAIKIGLGGSRVALLICMIGIFWHLSRQDVRELRLDADETEALVGSLNSHYGSTQGAQGRQNDAQSSGWIDYFVGFRALFPYIWPSDSKGQQTVTLICFGLMICQRLVNILVPYQLSRVVDSLGVGAIPWKDILLYCLYRALQGQQGIIGSIRAMLWIPISQSLYQRLTYAAYEHVLTLSLDFHLSKKIGEVLSALNKGGSLNTFLDGFAFQLFPMVFDLGVAAVYFFINFDAFYSIIVIGVMWSYLFVTVYMAKYRGRARREMAKRDREMEATKTDTMMAYETVHHNSAVPYESSRFRSTVKFFQVAEFSVLFSLNGLNAIQNFVFILGVILVSLLSAYQISTGVYKVSDFILLITYFAQLHAPLAFFGSFYTQVQNNLVDAERMLDLFNTHPTVVDDPRATTKDFCDGRVEFDNVGFAYDGRKPALRSISFVVEPGMTTALVGESGSGKSTILKLLFRFYNASAGSIRVDNEDVKGKSIQSLREYIGVVPQDTILFNDTLMYNLLYARPNATQAEVIEACKAASIHQRILNFPDGYETAVGERGLKMSGGEKQRVAIARALLKSPQILLLDEATASLDSHTENQIQEALEKVTRNRTTITIAHRLSTVTRADQILLLHDGEIVERGTHSELLTLNNRYKAMWVKQVQAERAAKEKKDAPSPF